MTELTSTASRRALLAATGAGMLTFCLGGCAAGGQDTGPAATGGGTATGDGSGGVTVPASQIPLGSGIIVGSFVVTQPNAGVYEAFGSLCTHQNLPVQKVSEQGIICGRHGSIFSLTDGSVVTGPATTPLTAANVTQNGDTLTIS